MPKTQTPSVVVVTQLMSLLPESLRVIVAGGAARDLMLGNVPQDFDLWVVQDIDVQEAFAEIEEVLLAYRIKYDTPVGITEVHSKGGDYNGMGKDEESRGLDFVFKLVVDGVGIDIIKLTRPKGEQVSPAGVVSTFDFPINQFWIAQEGIIGIGHFHSPQVALRPLTDERFVHMHNKFPTLHFIRN